MSPAVSRILVTIVGLPVVIGLLWLGGWWLWGLAAAAALLGLHEFYAMTRPLRPLPLAGYGSALAALAGAELGGALWMTGGFLVVFVLAFVFQAISRTRAPATVAIGSTVLGAAWIGLPLGCLLLLRQIPAHPRLAVLAVFLAIWADSTLAYFGGRLLGRHRMAPVLSPGKTWEGLAFGAAAAVFVTFVSLYDNKATFLTVWQAIVLGLVLAIAEVTGDLFESMLKRDMQVKDTGRLLGGHGGVLDRVDSLLFAIPAAYFLVAAFGYA
jgi:phosphatidate cytidylyltransferase